MDWLAIFQHNFSSHLCTFFQSMNLCLETIDIETYFDFSYPSQNCKPNFFIGIACSSSDTFFRLGEKMEIDRN